MVVVAAFLVACQHPAVGGGGGGGGGGGDNGGCNGIPDCGVNNEPGPINLPDVPLDDGLIVPTGCNNCITLGLHPESTPNPVISILGVATLLVLAVPEILIGLGMLALLGAGPPGWAFDVFAMLPLELAMTNLSIFAAQVAATGSLDHDVLPLWPGDQ